VDVALKAWLAPDFYDLAILEAVNGEAVFDKRLSSGLPHEFFGLCAADSKTHYHFISFGNCVMDSDFEIGNSIVKPREEVFDTVYSNNPILFRDAVRDDVGAEESKRIFKAVAILCLEVTMDRGFIPFS
jgi:hypothetical protein